MAKDRVIQCQYYICEGNCSRGREGIFWGYCQHCDKYNKKRGSQPARTDNRRQKLEIIYKKEKYD